MSIDYHNDEDFVSTLRKGIVEEEQGQEDIVNFLLEGNFNNFKVSPSKILNDYLKQVYNVQLLGVVHEDNGKNTLSFQIILDPDDSPIINNMKVRSADHLSETAQKISNRSYRFISIKDKSLKPEHNTYAIQYQNGKYYKVVKGKIVSAGYDNITDII